MKIVSNEVLRAEGLLPDSPNTCPYTDFNDWIASRTPYKILCGDNKTATFPVRAIDSLHHTHAVVNHKNLRRWIILDFDWETFLLDGVHRLTTLIDSEFPTPNFIVVSKNGDGSLRAGCHAFYAIDDIATSDKARVQPIKALKVVTRGLTNWLGADPAYTGYVSKNPFCDDHHRVDIHRHIYSLSELEVADDYARWDYKRSAPDAESLGVGRNCDAFNIVRYQAYQLVTFYKRHHSEAEWFGKILSLVNKQNNKFASPLTSSEAAGIARSISGWVWNRYTGDKRGINRGVMEFGEFTSIESRQRLSARRTHQIRRDNTEKHVHSVVTEILAAGDKPTSVRVAEACQISRQTAAKYIKTYAAPTRFSPQCGGITAAAKSVKYGVHQVYEVFSCLTPLGSVSNEVLAVPDSEPVINEVLAVPDSEPVINEVLAVPDSEPVINEVLAVPDSEPVINEVLAVPDSEPVINEVLAVPDSEPVINEVLAVPDSEPVINEVLAVPDSEPVINEVLAVPDSEPVINEVLAVPDSEPVINEVLAVPDSEPVINEVLAVPVN